MLCRGRSQYKCQSRHKQDTKSHHYNCDGIISGNLEHRETPKIADHPVWSPKWPKVDIRLFKEEKNDLLWLVKPIAKAKTVQNCSARTSLGNGRVTTNVGERPDLDAARKPPNAVS